MSVPEMRNADNGRTATPDVKLTPAAQPPSPQPSITGAQTAHPLEELHPEGFLFSIDWLWKMFNNGSGASGWN